MSLSLSTSCVQKQEIRQEHKLTLPAFTPGELELLSLHRIRARIASLDIDPEVKKDLINRLLTENANYRREQHHNRYCLTLNHLDNAVLDLEESLQATIDTALLNIRVQAISNAVRTRLQAKLAENITLIKLWFHDKYDEILYSTYGKIPWAIVTKLRARLTIWAVDHSNPFDTPIEDLIEETLIANGLNPDDYDAVEDQWEALKSVK